jgi:uroporphyrinogen decarboxylase
VIGFPRLPVVSPAPDASGCIDILMGRKPGPRPPLVEYLVDASVQRPILSELLGRTWADFGPDRASQAAYLDNQIELWRRLGYDFVRFETGFAFAEPLLQADDATTATGRRGWADEHGGTIRGRDDYERFAWPRFEAFDFFPYEHLASRLPEGMGLMACHAGGVFEHLSWLLSLEGLAFALADDRDLVRAVVDKIGGLMLRFYEHLLDLPGLIAIFPGDDMGFKTGPLVSPADLREFVLPWHARFAALAHAKDRPYFLHSCGNLAAILPDLIDTVGIDGKHSFEDIILPAEEFQARWGGRTATLGGLDLNILAGGTEDDVRRRTRALIETCAPRGRYAVGSGNSIPSYVPVRNYLAMLDEALRLRS